LEAKNAGRNDLEDEIRRLLTAPRDHQTANPPPFPQKYIYNEVEEVTVVFRTYGRVTNDVVDTIRFLFRFFLFLSEFRFVCGAQ